VDIEWDKGGSIDELHPRAAEQSVSEVGGEVARESLADEFLIVAFG
jgi:hypothetical protein